MTIYRRLPSSDLSVQWSPGVNNFALVNDPIGYPDGDTTYTYTMTQTNKDYFNFPTFNIPAGSPIASIKVVGRFRRIDAGGSYIIRELIKVNGVTYAGIWQQVLVNGYFVRSHTWTKNPNNNANWTVNDVNGVGPRPLQALGYECIGFNKTVRCTQLYIQANFTYIEPRLPLMRDVATSCLMRDVATNKLMRAVEFEAGADCGACFVAGKTPKYYTLTFSSVALCPTRGWPGGASLNQKWLLEQIIPETDPCFWRYLDANWLILLNLDVGRPLRTWVRAYTPGGTNYHYFSYNTEDPCLVSGTVDNDYDDASCSGAIFGKYGSVLIEQGEK